MTQFAKPAIDVTQQLELLKARGLQINDEKRAARFLEVVSFFRLTPYMRPFQVPGYDHHFIKDAGFRDLSNLYAFDRRLRLLVMDAIERVEVAVRAMISNYMGPMYGAHWYLDRTLFKSGYNHEQLLQIIRGKQQSERRDYERECDRIDRLAHTTEERKTELKIKRSKESYARHYGLTYGEPQLMPGWAALEELTMGSLSHLYAGLARDSDKKAIAKRMDLPWRLLQSWLHTLTIVRNICAHHARLWNRELGIKPELPKKASFPWPASLTRPSHHVRIYVVLCMLNHLMRTVSPDTSWQQRLKSLFDEFPSVSEKVMGFPADWRNDIFWS
tara:strand:+ start:17302 stop:18291 length:990 start_codon:yes stop_codon:yes gene_type:complete